MMVIPSWDSDCEGDGGVGYLSDTDRRRGMFNKYCRSERGAGPSREGISFICIVLWRRECAKQK